MQRLPARAQARGLSLVALTLAAIALNTAPVLSAPKKKSAPQPVEYGTLSGPPMLAVISLKDQRIAVYDGAGNAMGARISSGNAGNETPVGIFSVLQKNRDHVSNVFDVEMPFMQRLTWTGVAMHQGVLPGYPASHGCIRMPGKFAERLFPLTKIGMRVVVARDNTTPVDITHPNLLQPAPPTIKAQNTALTPRPLSEDGPQAFYPDLSKWPQRQAEHDELMAQAALKAALATEAKAPLAGLQAKVAVKTKSRAAAAKKAQTTANASKAAQAVAVRAQRALASAMNPARLKPFEVAKAKAAAAVERATAGVTQKAAGAASALEGRPRAQAQLALRRAEAGKRTAERQLAAASRALARAADPARYRPQQATSQRSQSLAATAERSARDAQTALTAAEAAHAQAQTDLATATATSQAASDAAKDAERQALPVSMFVSLKTQRLYVRQGHEPVLDMPIAIADPGRPIGNYVYTAVDYGDDGETLRWMAVSVNRAAGTSPGAINSAKERAATPVDAVAPATDDRLAAAALERITLPAQIAQRFKRAAWPGASLIVSDEAPSKETSLATDFVIFMSDEPKGGLKATKREAAVRKPVYASSFGIFSASSPPAPVKSKVKPGKSVFGFW